MPLIVLCGIPCSGKTTYAQQLQEYFSSTFQVILVNEEMLNIDKQHYYSTSHLEKVLRSSIKATVEREIGSSNLVIVDSMNYIKGYRYELHCLVRGQRTTQCTIWADTTIETALSRNSVYDEQQLVQIANRFEAPIGSNRWDRPLFRISEGQQLPFEEIQNALTSGQQLRNPVSTKREVLAEQNYVYIIEDKTKKIVDFIIESQQQYGEGALVAYENVNYQIEKIATPLELKRVRMQFLNLSKNTPYEIPQIAEAFINYISSALQVNFNQLNSH